MIGDVGYLACYPLITVRPYQGVVPTSVGVHRGRDRRRHPVRPEGRDGVHRDDPV